MKKGKTPGNYQNRESVNYSIHNNALIPDTIPGCFGMYASDILSDCHICNVKLQCARQTEGSE